MGVVSRKKKLIAIHILWRALFLSSLTLIILSIISYQYSAILTARTQAELQVDMSASALSTRATVSMAVGIILFGLAFYTKQVSDKITPRELHPIIGYSMAGKRGREIGPHAFLEFICYVVYGWIIQYYLFIYPVWSADYCERSWTSCYDYGFVYFQMYSTFLILPFIIIPIIIQKVEDKNAREVGVPVDRLNFDDSPSIKLGVFFSIIAFILMYAGFLIGDFVIGICCFSSLYLLSLTATIYVIAKYL